MWFGIILFFLAILIAGYIYCTKIYLFQFAYLLDPDCYLLIVVFFSLILPSLVRLVRLVLLDLRDAILQGAINTEYALIHQAQRVILGLANDEVTQLRQQIIQAEQAEQEKEELKKKIQQLEHCQCKQTNTRPHQEC
jgi:hypothetical protein